MKMAQRTFGVELEVINLSQGQCYRALREAGIRVQDPSRYYDDDGAGGRWGIKEDCSISSPNGRSAEVVSPILSGVKGLREVRKVCRALSEAGAWVNDTCGLHVHVGATKGDHKLTPNEVATLITRYAQHEKMIDRFVHPDRREDRGEFCQSMIDAAEELKDGGIHWIKQDLEHYKQSIQQCQHQNSVWNPRTRYYNYVSVPADQCYQCQRAQNEVTRLTALLETRVQGFSNVDDIADVVSERYSKVNMQAWYDHGTIEFRHHNGALDPKTVANWVRFVVTFVEQSRRISAKKGKDTGPLAGLPTGVRKFYKTRAAMRTRDFDAWA